MRALTRFDQPQAKPLDPRHVELALRNCYVTSRRLAALLMYDAGLRRGEVSRLRWDEHVDFRRDGTIWLYPLGKGSKRRKLVATRRLAKALGQAKLSAMQVYAGIADEDQALAVEQMAVHREKPRQTRRIKKVG